MRRWTWLPLLALAACAAGPTDTHYETVRDNGEPMRSAFNEAAGKVRTMFLAAPT